jgi:hypothetical protein
MSKKPITVYWSPYVHNENSPDWSFLYPKPVSVFSDHLKNKDKSSKNHFFQCPATSSKIKKTLVFKCPMTFGYDYDFSGDEKMLNLNTDNGIAMNSIRDNMLSIGPNFKLSLGYAMFADESLEVSFTSPFFHKAKYMENCSTIPGNFNIGEWYRPYSFEVQTWSDKGSINFVEGEALIYAEFKTDRPIILKRYQQNQLLVKYSEANIGTSDLFGAGLSLRSRYEKFRSIGMREKVLTEINKNLIDEDYMTL